jgi:hypothetical protein
VIAVGTEGRNEEGGVVVEGIVPGDGEEEIFVNVFVLWAPDLLTVFIDDSVLMGVVGDSGGTRQGGEKVGEEFSFQGDGEQEVGEDESGQGGGGNDSNRGFSNGQWEVLNRDVGKQDALDNFLKLVVDIGILVFGGQGILKLRAYNVSLLGSDIGKNVEEVGQGCGNGGWGQGAVGVGAITTWAGVIPGVVRTIEVVLDDLVGSSNVDLVSVVNLRPISNREGRGDDKGW